MVAYRMREIRNWIGDIEDRTRSNCDSVLRRFDAAKPSSRNLLSGADGKDRLFAALFTGDYQQLRRETFSPDWVSWIEGQPPYHWLMTHGRVLIDLVPCDELGFLNRYGCTPSQFAALVERMPDSVRINVRNDRTIDYGHAAVIQPMGEILALSERYPNSFYRLDPIRQAAFGLLDAKYQEMQEQAELFCRNYAEFYDSVLAPLSREPDPDLRPVTRDGRWPPPAQLRGRLTYYLVARRLWVESTDDAPVAADERIEEWLKPEEPLDFRFSDLSRLKGLMGRLYATHHLYTAQLTGALGGQYGWLSQEMDYAASFRGAISPPQEAVEARPSISTWLFALQAGLTNLGEAKFESAPIPFWRNPSDDEWRSFLDRAPLNRHKVRENMAEVVGIIENARDRLRKAHPPKSDKPDDGSRDLEELSEVLNSVFKKCTEWRVASAAGATLGLGFMAVSMPVLTGILGGLWMLADANPSTAHFKERISDLPSRLCKNRMDRVALGGIINALDLPNRRPGRSGTSANRPKKKKR